MRYLSLGQVPQHFRRKKLQRFKKRALQFFIFKGQLFRIHGEGVPIQTALAIPENEAKNWHRKDMRIQRVPLLPSERSQVMQGNHEEIPGGHRGVDGTLSKIIPRYWWPGIREHVKNHVKTCDKCQRRSKKRIWDPLILMPTPDVFETVHIDILGPFEKSAGRRYVLAARCAL